jgi:IPT/TIG domain
MEIRIIHDISPALQHTIKELIMAQSQWLAQTLALISTIAVNSAGTAANAAAIADLTTRLQADEATEADLQTAVTALATQLANSTPPAAKVPTVTGVSPNTDKLAGGTVLTVTGTGFSVSAPTVSINGVAGTAVSVASDTSLKVTTGAQAAAGTFDLLVTTSSGTSVASAADQIAYS